MESDIVTSALHTQEACEHGPALEINIITLKDITRSTVHLVTYWKISLMIIDSIVE